MRALWLSLAFLALVVPAGAQETAASCAAIAADPARLACYDALFRDITASVPSDAIVLESERLIPAQPSGRRAATLSISCEAGAPLVTFAFAGQAMSATGDIAPLTLQVDQNATAVRTLTAAPNNQSLSFSTARDTTAFLDSLEGGTNLKVRATPVRQRSLTVDFRLPEILPQVEALRDSCK